MDHIQTPRPALAAGRHFIARGVQHCTDLDSAVSYLTSGASAGGFTYTIGEVGSGRVVTVETAAGRSATVEAEPRTGAKLWHSNHLRFLTEGEPNDDPASVAELPQGQGGHGGRVEARSLSQREESLRRCAVLESMAPPTEGPDVGWFLDVLTGAPMPDGVYRSAQGDDPSMTLCSTVVDLTAQEITLKPRAAVASTTPVGQFALGPP